MLGEVLSADTFLSPHGLRALSREHHLMPFRIEIEGVIASVDYEPGESTNDLFGGNSNWRGPVWFPLNYLIIEALQKLDWFYGASFTVEHPVGSGVQRTLWEVSVELSRRLIGLFVPDADGVRPAGGSFPEHPTFFEYFHGDTGAGLGASHQTGWTALVAKLIRQSDIDTDL